MNDLLAKISSYNIFNYLFPGAVFTILAGHIDAITVPPRDIVTMLLIYYFVGMVVSRVGSLVLEPLFGKTGFVKYSEYSDYIRATEKDSKIEILVEVTNTYRTLTAVFLCLPTALAGRKVADALSMPSSLRLLVLAALMLVVFSVSFRKQSGYIRKRVQHHQK